MLINAQVSDVCVKPAVASKKKDRDLDRKFFWGLLYRYTYASLRTLSQILCSVQIAETSKR